MKCRELILPPLALLTTGTGFGSFITGLHKIGACFVKAAEEDEGENLIVAEFMEKVLKIEDPNFKIACNDQIKKMLRQEFKRMNGKIASTYRKNLTECKL